MTRRLLALGLAAAMLALGATNAWSASVSLETLVSNFGTPAGTLTADNLVFSDFTFMQTSGTPPDATGITVTTTPSIIPGPGLEFLGNFVALAGTTPDWKIGFRVDGVNGALINGASLGIAAGNFGGNGQVSVAETVSWPTQSGNPSRGMEATVGSLTDTATPPIPPQPFVTVAKDISLIGGTSGSTVSIIDQTFTTTGVIPEPTSMALLGLGLTGLFTFRRFFKRAFIA